jgi:hypothetical protein
LRRLSSAPKRGHRGVDDQCQCLSLTPDSNNLSRSPNPCRSELLRMLCEHQPKEVVWHLLQMTPRVNWRGEDLPAVYGAVTRSLSESSSILRVCAMQAMADLLSQLPERWLQVAHCVQGQLKSGTPAIRARARRLLLAFAQRLVAGEAS